MDALKVAKVLLDGDKISEDCMVLFDEMYLQKGTQYQGGRFIGANEFGNFFKGIVCFKQKADGDKPRKDNIKAFKKRQRCEKQFKFHLNFLLRIHVCFLQPQW